MSDRKRIMLFGLKDEQITALVKCFSQCDFTYARDWRDIIAFASDLVIADFSELQTEEIAVIYDYYKQIEPAPEKMIITNANQYKENIKSVIYQEDLFESERSTRTKVLGTLHDTMRDVDFSRRLVMSLNIMRTICHHPGISTKELADLEEISQRSIKRYIESLRMAGAIINYQDKGWHCEFAVWDY